MFNFENVGKEIKMWAKTLAVLTFIPFCIGGLAVLFGAFAALGEAEGGAFLLGLIGAALIVGVGYLVARLSAIILYGFGELVDKTSDTNERVAAIEKKLPAQSAAPTASAAPAASPKIGNPIVDSAAKGISDR